MSAQTRRVALAGVTLVALGGAMWVLLANRDDGTPPSGGTVAGRDAMAGRDMPGMQMEDGSVQITASQLRQFGITFGSVEERRLENEIRTVGIVNFDETRMAQVAPKFGGFIERLDVDFTGKAVRRGQPLFEIYSPELVAAQEELLAARRLERTMDATSVPGVPTGSSDLLGAVRRRLRLWDISEGQIDEILRTGQVRRTLTLFAPASGVVVEKHVVVGQAVQAGQTLYTIADLSEVWVEAELREAQAGRVREGSGATVELAAFPGRPFQGRVEYVYPTLEQETRTVKVRIAVANSEGRLKPGMYATARIETPGATALTVPRSAVLRTGERNLVFVDMGGGRLMPHEVELAREGADYIEVLSGLEPGQRVVTSGQFLLDSESNLAEVMRAMMGQMSPSDMPSMDMPGMQMPMDESAAPPRR
ncbi:MAG: efflux RND transporter periplasmic adaptor subunit [Gemmatimonadaceae bacterium]